MFYRIKILFNSKIFAVLLLLPIAACIASSNKHYEGSVHPENMPSIEENQYQRFQNPYQQRQYNPYSGGSYVNPYYYGGQVPANPNYANPNYANPNYATPNYNGYYYSQPNSGYYSNPYDIYDQGGHDNDSYYKPPAEADFGEGLNFI